MTTLGRRFCMRELAVALETTSPDVDAAFAHIVNHARDDYPTTSRVTFTVERQPDGTIEVSENGARRSLKDANAMLAAVHRRLSTHLLAVHDPRPAVHAGAATVDGRLVVLTGNRGAGKTTLLLRLALDGAVFHCDEHVIADGAGSIRTLPRRLHVKPGTLSCLPEIAEACQAHPLLQLEGGVRFFPLDVSELGLTWRSADARPAAWIHLSPGFDGPPEVAPIPQIEMVKRLMHQSLGDLDFGRQAANIAAVVRGVPCYAMRGGDLAASAELVRRAVGSSLTAGRRE